MNLLLLAPGEVSLDRRDPRARHIEKVLGARVGERVRAGILGGTVGTASITAIDRHEIRLEVDVFKRPQPLPPLELLLGHPRPIVLKRMLRDLTAIGLKRIVIAPTDLGEKSYYSSNMWHRAESLMIEGASQGGTTLLPELIRAQSLEASIDRLAAASVARLVLHPSAAERRVVLQDALAERAAAPLSIAIGSERGWSERELRLLDARGFERVALGARVLRTETAATVAVWAAAEHLRRAQSSAPVLP